jgi:hypothetical protein
MRTKARILLEKEIGLKIFLYRFLCTSSHATGGVGIRLDCHASIPLSGTSC